MIESEKAMEEFEDLKKLVHEDISKKLSLVDTKLNFVLGGLAVVGVILPIIIDLLEKTHPGA